MLGHAIHTLGMFKAAVILVAVPYALYAVKKKKRRERLALSDDQDLGPNSDSGKGKGARQQEDTFGTLEDLERAERQVRQTLEQKQASVGADFVLHSRYSTYAGFDDRFMTDLVAHLRRNGLKAKWIFHQAFSRKAARSLKMAGTFELYVHKNQLHLAEAHIATHQKKGS